MTQRVEPTSDQKELLLKIARLLSFKRTGEEMYVRYVQHALREGYQPALVARYAGVTLAEVEELRNAPTNIIWPNIVPRTGGMYMVEDLTDSKPSVLKRTEEGWEKEHEVGHIYYGLTPINPTFPDTSDPDYKEQTEEEFWEGTPDPGITIADHKVVERYYGDRIDTRVTKTIALHAMNFCQAVGEDWNDPEMRELYLETAMRGFGPKDNPENPDSNDEKPKSDDPPKWFTPSEIAS